MMTYLSGGYDLSGFAAADKIVGKAAAMLFVLADVKAVYAPVMSETAKEILMQHGIDAEYDQLTDQIINRAGTDLCPMEKAVREIADPQEAFYAIRRTMEYLQSQAKE